MLLIVVCVGVSDKVVSEGCDGRYIFCCLFSF